MKIKVTEFCNLLQAKFIGESTDIEFTHVSTDSRSLQNNENTLFFALQGANHDAHHYINDLIGQGVKNFVVSKPPINSPKNISFFVVDGTLRAFQKYVTYYRSQFDFPVIGITGSRGKTVVKEWLNYLMNPYFNIIKNPKSYNSQVGVPLSVLGIDHKHNFGIFEAGISTVNEMEFIEPIIQPSIGVLTYIGSDHDEGFQSSSQKIQEKLKLFSNTNKVILQWDESVLGYFNDQSKVFTWSFSNRAADVFIQSLADNLLRVDYNNKCFEVAIPFNDPNSLFNIATCISVLLYLNFDIEIIQERIPKLYNVEMRLQVKNGVNQCTIIDDSYSSDFQSLKIALDFLENHKRQTSKTVILSDIFQSGLPEKELYNQLRVLLESNKINRIIGIGNSICKNMLGMKGFYGYKNTEIFLHKISKDEFENETILIKGARGFHFERIVSLLEEKTHETVLEVDLNAIRHNLNFYRSKLKSNTKIMVMVKAFGYGNGSTEIAKLLAYDNVDYLGVAFADEGVELRKSGVNLPIIVMNPEESAFSTMIAYDLEPEIYSIGVLRTFQKYAQEKNTYRYPIHLKLDTGMHRLGFMHKDISELITILKRTNILQVQSIFSHLSSSDIDEFNYFTINQIEDFKLESKRISDELEISPIRHILNTSGIYNFPEYQMEMVRLGIGLYGIGNHIEEIGQLQNASTLKTVILQIRTIEKGESVGYSRIFRAVDTTRVATIPIGYADGIPRAWGNKLGHVFINDTKAPIIGNICMDMMMIDVTDINCKEGDEVVIFGEKLPVTEIASKLNTISYEIMASISQRVKRVFYQ